MRPAALLLCFAVCLTLLTKTGLGQQLLTPYNSNPYSSDYDEVLKSLLLMYKQGDESLSIYRTYFLCKPSFSPEYALGLREKRGKKVCDSLVLTRVEGRTSLWYQREYGLNKNERKRQKPITTQRYTMAIGENDAIAIEKLFRSAVMTSSYFADSRMGGDGTTYIFCQGDKAKTWSPENETRAHRLVMMADSLCTAVKNGDTTLVERQMKTCRQLTNEFRNEYPLHYFRTIRQQKSDTTTLYATADFVPIVTIRRIGTMTSESDDELLLAQLQHWAKELFVEDYPFCVQIDIRSDSAYCRFRKYEYWNVVEIAIPERLLTHHFLFSTLRQPYGDYKLNGQDEWELLTRP